MNENIKEIAKIVIKELDKNTDGTFYTEEIATALHKAGYRKQSETVKEFAEKIDLYLIKLFHQAHDSQKECEQHNGTAWENGWQRKDERMIMIQNDIQPFIRQVAEQYGKEEI